MNNNGGEISNSRELEFVLFCIENISLRLNIDARPVYNALSKKSDILSGYIVLEYESLHRVSDMHCMSDLYLAKELDMEYCDTFSEKNFFLLPDFRRVLSSAKIISKEHIYCNHPTPISQYLKYFCNNLVRVSQKNIYIISFIL